MSPVPRAEVIDSAWRALGPGLEPLSAPDGGPLSRTVKLVVVPLVLRPTTHRELAAAVLGPDEAATVGRLVTRHRDDLVAAARWFVLLARRSTTWQPAGQVSRDSCYPTAFELAVRHGAPDPATADAVVEEALAELASTRLGQTPAALARLLGDPRAAARLAADLESAWDRDRPARTAVPASLDSQCTAFLDTFAPGGAQDDRGRTSADRAWRSIIAAGFGRDTGWCVRADLWPATVPGPARARRLGFTDAERPARPALDGRSGADASRPWDRTVAERVLEVLRHCGDRTVLPDLADLVADEVARACAPWELAEEVSRAMLVVGTVLVLGLASDDGATTRAHRIVTAMRRRESWLAWAARRPGVPTGRGPAPEPSDTPPTPLQVLGAELADPVAPYLRRLWARLHGAEARGAVPADAADVQSLLIGVQRSVLLDGRSRVRAALTRLREGRP